jgi:putative ABC transport system permease protein
MLQNYFRVALRYFYKSKVHTFINLAGLTLGITCVFLIALYIQHEVSFDRFHDHAEDLYRITWFDENPQTRTPHPMAQAMVADFPEVQSAVSLTPLFGSGLTLETHSFRNLEKDERFDETRILAVDTTFFDVFSFPVIRGDAKNALKQFTGGLMISESKAKKYFDDADPLGKQLAVDGDEFLVDVVAVFKDVPANSHFQFDFLVSYVREKAMDGDDPFYSWADFGHYNYIRLKPGADPKALEEKLLDWVPKYLQWTPEDVNGLKASGFGFRVQPVTDIHLQSHLRWELGVNGNLESVYILGAAALLILVIACLNFMNLTTAKSTERAKEIGIRKSLGAQRKQLAFQFIQESTLVALVAVALAAVMVDLSLPLFNNLTGSALEVSYSQYLLALVILGAIIGILAGFYPALYLASAKPTMIMKGQVDAGSGGGTFRSLMIAFQFGMSTALISGALIIYNQLDYLQNRPLGFEAENVLVLPIKSESLSDRFQELKTELERVEGVTSVSATSNIPGRQFNQNNIAWTRFPEDDIATSECMIDPDFFRTLNIELKDGRFFSTGAAADSVNTYLLNETAVQNLNLDNPIGAEINWYRDGFTEKGRVIGVVKDFHFQSLHEPLRPMLFALGDNFNFVVIRGTFSNLKEDIAAIQAVYRTFDNTFEFEFAFLDDQLQQQYESERRLGTAIAIFSIIAVAIACAGLFGMALILFNRKIKEISIRKVLGASSLDLLARLLRSYTLLVLLAGFVAAPLTWWTMNKWLANFNYRIEVSALVFIVAIGMLLCISWITLSYLTLKTTRLNPADTLKSE